MDSSSSSSAPANPQHSPRSSISLLNVNSADEVARLAADNQRMNALGLALQTQLAEVQARELALTQKLAAAKAVKGRSTIKAPPLAPYSGAMNSAIDPWLRNVQKQFAFDEFQGAGQFTTDSAKIAYAAMFFDGPAADWWSSVDRSAVQTWSQFVECAQTRWRPGMPAEAARARLANLKQKGHVSAYCNLFLQIVAHIPDKSEADKIFDFKRGLNAALATRVAEKAPKTLEEAMNLCVRLDPFLSSTAPRPWSQQAASSSSSSADMDLNNLEYDLYALDDAVEAPESKSDALLAEMLSKMQAMELRLNSVNQSGAASSSIGKHRNKDRVPGLTRDDVVRMLAEGRCFNCNSKEHMKRDCPQPVRRK